MVWLIWIANLNETNKIKDYSRYKLRSSERCSIKFHRALKFCHLKENVLEETIFSSVSTNVLNPQFFSFLV